MKILALIKLLETRKKQFCNIEVVDDLGYITNDLAHHKEDNSLIIVKKKKKKVGNNGKD